MLSVFRGGTCGLTSSPKSLRSVVSLKSWELRRNRRGRYHEREYSRTLLDSPLSRGLQHFIAFDNEVGSIFLKRKRFIWKAIVQWNLHDIPNGRSGASTSHIVPLPSRPWPPACRGCSILVHKSASSNSRCVMRCGVIAIP